ncbi:MAG: hypothetical protein M3O71_09775 [Bacteroidota bacterium]|nr:hypothetical protein [Bacteroidota bacterium]
MTIGTQAAVQIHFPTIRMSHKAGACHGLLKFQSGSRIICGLPEVVRPA